MNPMLPFTSRLLCLDKMKTQTRFTLCGIRLGLFLIGFGIAGFTALAQAHVTPSRQVVRATLKNGMQVVIVPNPLAPVVTTVINYRVGSNEAPKGFPGTAHATEHMMFRGSKGLSADQLAEIASSMGGDFDADTQQVVTQYFFTVPAKDLNLALHIESIRMQGLAPDPKLWQQERGAIEQEVAQDLSSPEYVAYIRVLADLFKGTPYAHDALGTRPSFNATTSKMLRQFHQRWYVPNNAVLVIAGKVDPAAALKQVKHLFGRIPSKALPARPKVKLQAVSAKTLHLTTDQPNGTAMIAFRMPGFNSPDYAAAEVLSDVLSSQRNDLYDLVVQGKALDAGFDLNAFAPAGIGFAYVAYPTGANAEQLLKDVRGFLKRKLKHGVSAELVKAAKQHELAQAEFQKNSISGLAMLWSQALAIEGRSSPKQDLDAIRRVTVADVERVARKYLDLKHAVTVVLAPTASGKPVASKGFGGRESFAPSKVKAVTLPKWARKALQRIAIPRSNVHPVDMKLPNGIRLIVQPTDVSNTVSVYGHIRNRSDMEEPKGKEGVNLVLSQLFGFGTTSLNRLQFQKALDDIAADESAGTDFSVQVLRTHFDRAVQLLADNELHPALPARAFKVVRHQLAGYLTGRNSSPGYLTSRAIRAALFSADDPTLRQATPKTVAALQLKDVKAYFHHVYRPDLTTIVVIGNVTPRQARTTIEKYFGGWKARGPKPQTLLPPAPLNKPGMTTVPDHSRVQDKVVQIETLGLKRSNPDYYALQLGNHVLGGGFYSTRLYRDLREHSGLVYYVSSAFEVGKTRAIYEVSFACDPPNVSHASAIIKRDLKAMQTTLVTPAELHNARASLLRAIPLSESSTNSIAMGLLSRASHDLPLNEPLRAAKYYAHLSAKAVEKAFAKWVRPDAMARIVQGPAPH